MAAKVLCVTSIVCGVLAFLATLAICVWLGVVMLVPQNPFSDRNIAGGICLIVFSVLTALVAGLFVWFWTGGFCLIACDQSRHVLIGCF
jgi:ABC-type dipeptide/oligopeptide/nickel transport system permease component